MKPHPFSRDPSPVLGMAGIQRRRRLLAGAAAGAAALAALCLPLPLAIPLAVLTTLVAAAIGIGSRLIAIDHG